MDDVAVQVRSGKGRGASVARAIFPEETSEDCRARRVRAGICEGVHSPMRDERRKQMSWRPPPRLRRDRLPRRCADSFCRGTDTIASWSFLAGGQTIRRCWRCWPMKLASWSRLRLSDEFGPACRGQGSGRVRIDGLRDVAPAAFKRPSATGARRPAVLGKFPMCDAASFAAPTPRLCAYAARMIVRLAHTLAFSPCAQLSCSSKPAANTSSCSSRAARPISIRG